MFIVLIVSSLFFLVRLLFLPLASLSAGGSIGPRPTICPLRDSKQLAGGLVRARLQKPYFVLPQAKIPCLVIIANRLLQDALR